MKKVKIKFLATDNKKGWKKDEERMIDVKTANELVKLKIVKIVE